MQLANFVIHVYLNISFYDENRFLYSVVNQLIDKQKPSALPTASSDKELVDKFNRFFNEKIELIRSKFLPSSYTSENQCLFSGESKLSVFEPTNATEISEILKSYPLKCSPDDPVPAGLLSSNQDVFIPFWVDIVNLSLSTSCMDGLKTGTLIPLIKELNKTTDVENLKNYRPVTNLPFLSKLVERVVQIRLNKHMSNNNLADHNFAYRKVFQIFSICGFVSFLYQRDQSTSFQAIP